MRFTNSGYDSLKKLLFINCPATSLFIFVLSCVWDVPRAKYMIGAISVISLVFGVCLTVSTKRYQDSDSAYDGQIVVTEVDDKKRFSLELAGDPDDLELKKVVVFKMVSAEPSLEE